MKKILCALAALGVLFSCSKNQETKIDPTSVSLNKHDIWLVEGETAALTATVAPDNATNKSLNWSSSSPAVATVDQSGNVTAVAEGQAIIMVATVSGGKTDACNVHVSKKGPDPEPGDVVESVTVSPAAVEVAEGASAQLTASASPSTASQEMEWASQNTAVATVDANGLITGVSTGTTKIFARSKAYPEKQGFCEVTVVQDPTLKGISFGVSEVSLAVGQTYTLNVIYNPSYATNKNVSWSSNNADVASVSSEGIVTAQSEGAATITATSEEGGYTASCTFVVSKDATGPYVYYALSSSMSDLLVNGELDPRTGMYNDETLSYWYLEGVCSDGLDLYTIEYYSDWYYNGYSFICKNRKPLYEIPVDSKFDPLKSFTARNGYLAAVYKDNNSDDSYYAIRFAPDGTSTRCDIACVLGPSHMIHSALAPNGDLHLAAQIWDPFGDYYLVTYVFTVEGKLIETKIIKDNVLGSTKAMIDISDEGDVYILNNENVGETTKAVLYKNGTVVSSYGDIENYPILALKAANGHVYTAVLDIGIGKIVERCDDTVIRTLQVDENQSFDDYIGHPLQVTSNGDIYLATSNYIYKNDNAIVSVPEDYICYFCVVE